MLNFPLNTLKTARFTNWGDGGVITNQICVMPTPTSFIANIQNISTMSELTHSGRELYSNFKAYQDYHDQVGFTPLSPNVIQWLKKSYELRRRSVQFTVPKEFSKYDLALKNLVKVLEQATRFNSTNADKIAFVKKNDSFARRFESNKILLNGDDSPSDLAVTIHEAGHALGFSHPFHLETFPYIDTIYNNIMSYHFDNGEDQGPSTLSDKDLVGVSPICKNLARTFGTVLGVVLPEIYGYRAGAPNCTEELNHPQYHSKIFDRKQDNSFFGKFSNFFRNFFNSREREAYYASFYNEQILNILSMRLLIINHLIEKINTNTDNGQAVNLLEAVLLSAAFFPWGLSEWEQNIVGHYNNHNRTLPSLKNMTKYYDTYYDTLGYDILGEPHPNCAATLKQPVKYDDFKKSVIITAAASLGLLFTFAISVISYKCLQNRSNNFRTCFRWVGTRSVNSEYSPVGVSEYQLTRKLPDSLKNKLPDTQILEEEIRKEIGMPDGK